MSIAWLLFPMLCLALAVIGSLVARLADRAITDRAVPVRISERRQETPDTVSLFLDVPAGYADRFRHVPGQFVTIAHRVRGRAVQRSYSLANAPHEPLRITVKQEPGGTLSPVLCQKVRVGDELRVLPPQGRLGDAVAPSWPRPVWLWGAGSGMVPLRAIAVEVLSHQPERQVTWVHSNRHVEDVVYAGELAGLESEHPQQLCTYRRLTSVSPRLTPRDVATLVAAGVTSMTPRPGLAAEHFVCGPEGFMNAVEEGLRSAEVPAASIHREHFAASTRETHQRTGDEVRLVVHLDEEEVDVTGDRGITIVQALEDAGYDPPTSCRSGSCSTCLATALTGGATMENNDFLTDAEVAEGLLLTCQALPAADVVEVDYDSVR